MANFLLVILAREQPGLILLPNNNERITWNGLELKDTGIRTLVGFFDWLRTDEKEVIGVRLTIFDDELDNLLSEFSVPDYVHEMPETVGIEIFFSAKRSYNPDYSNDQDFMDSWIYRTDDGIFAISFNAQFAIESLQSNEKVVKI